MPYAMALSTRIRPAATKKRGQRIRQAKFGDGYSQEVAEGINNITEEWSGVGWDYLTSSELVVAREMLEGVGGTDYIRWTPPGDVSEKRYKVVNGWQESYVPGTAYTHITFDLRQVF